VHTSRPQAACDFDGFLYLGVILRRIQAWQSNQSGVSGMQTRVEQGQSSEDRFTGSIEAITSGAPSTMYLGLAVGAMITSAILKISGKDNWALFVGQWAAPFLIMGNYNKMVKQHGSDSLSRAA
jgi:hypothetical protein